MKHNLKTIAREVTVMAVIAGDVPMHVEIGPGQRCWGHG